ncbi:hypothetical protein BT69DRAFT_342199 [Atractiella rhizophila]|nr:hypothetical protein BT69DRAFT_342199 [Atractiella rhizophila]
MILQGKNTYLAFLRWNDAQSRIYGCWCCFCSHLRGRRMYSLSERSHIISLW